MRFRPSLFDIFKESKEVDRMKRRLLALALMVAAVLLITASIKTFSVQGAAAIILRSGTTGESVAITDPDVVAQITDNITRLSYVRIFLPSSGGWSYWLQWYDADGNLIDQLLPNSTGFKQNGWGYIAIGGTIDTDLFDELLGED